MPKAFLLAASQMAAYASTVAVFAFLLTIIACCGGCVTNKQWTKAGATTADVERAKLECKYDAAKSDVDVAHTTWQTEVRQMELIDMCLRVKGYSS